MKTLKKFFVIAALAMFMAGCSQGSPDEVAVSVGGIRLSIGETVARTALPSTFHFDSFQVVITPSGKPPLETRTIAGDDLDEPIELDPGDYSLTLSALIEEVVAATGASGTFTVGTVIVEVPVPITFTALSGEGKLKYTVTDSSGIEDANSTLAKSLTWIPLSGGTAQSWIDVKTTSTGEADLKAGYYLVNAIVDTWKEEAVASELVHIYNGQDTTLALTVANTYAKPVWLAGLVEPWVFPGTEMIEEGDGVYAWEGDAEARYFRFYVEDTSSWDNNQDKARRIQPYAETGNADLTVDQAIDAVFKERIGVAPNQDLSAYVLPEVGYYKITFNNTTMKVQATKPVIFEGITIDDDSAVFSANEQTVTLTPIFSGKNLPASPEVTWSVSGTGASIESGVLTIPADAAVDTVYTVTAEATINGVTKSDTATVTILAEPPKVTGIRVSSDAQNGEALVGNTVVFTAAVTGETGVLKAVTWTVKVGAGNAASAYTETAGTKEIDPTLSLTIAEGDRGKTITVTATSTVTGTVSDATDVFIRNFGDVYLIGSDFEGAWGEIIDPTKGQKLDYSGGGVYTTTAIMNPTSYFRFKAVGSEEFAPENDNADASNGEHATINEGNNAWKAADYGSYDISLNTGTRKATFTIAPVVISVTVNADHDTVYYGNTLQFTADVAGTTGSKGVTWSIEGDHAEGTTISTGGLLTVASGETVTSLTIKATPNLAGFTDKAGTKEITVGPEPGGANIKLVLEDLGAGLTLTKGDTTLTDGDLGQISKTGETKSITVAVTGDYTYDWVVNGDYENKTTASSITLDAADFRLGTYTLTLIATKGGVPWSSDKQLSFTVVK
jgi:hypothetical protein